MKIIFAGLAACLLISACKTVATKTSTDVKNDSSVSITRQAVKINDSVYTEPASNSSIELQVSVDTAGIIKPFSISVNKGSSKLKAFSTGGNKIQIIDSCGPVIARFKNLVNEQNNMIAQLKTRFIMEAKQNVVVKYKTPFWNWIIIGALLGLIGIIVFKNL